MSFGGFGNNNNTASTPFGGFGANNNTAASSAGGSLFGGTATSGTGFGAGGGFGANNNTSSPFGASKSAFGAPVATSAGGGMFGAGTSTTGGFGSGGAAGGSTFGANNNASGGFGASNTTGGSLFGASKTASTGFGAGTTGGGMFSSGNTGFGANNNAAPAASNPFGGAPAASSNPFGGNAAANNAGSNFAFGGNNANNTAGTTQGTPATPFTALTEKEGGTSNTTSAYQSLTFQQPFQNKSFEELRVEDYVQNKRMPQGNSFGSGSTFGGFGANNNAQAPTGQTGGGMFGGGSTGTTGGFGASTTNTGGGFGNNANATTGGLFGNKPPATGGLFGNNNASSGATTGGFGSTANGGGGLFGNNNATAQQPATGGGMFGGGTGGAFGSNNSTTGGGLFGQNNQAQQNQSKPFGGFGASTTNNNTTTGFGGFGANNQQAQQPAQTGGLFGSSTGTGFGSGATGGASLFGNNNNQAKPATGGLFGGNASTSNTGGGLFGASNNQQSTPFGQSNNNTGGGLFGTNQQANTGGGSLFGNQPAKPAGGLFGSSTTGNTGGTLFGNNNNQQPAASGTSLFGNNQNQGNSLFGANNQAKPAGGSLFGNNNSTNGQGGGLFGGSQNNNAGSSLFGGSQNQGNNSLFGNQQNQNNNSLFGGSQQNQQQQNQLSATLTGDPYGNAQLFSSLVAPSPPVGPLATPLSGAKPPPKPRASLLSSIRGGSPMLSASQSLTPKPRPGYGFSHSTYGSPALGSSQLTPGASSLLRPTGSISSALSGRLSKSFSTSNLRGEAGDGTSLLRTPVNGQSALLLGGGHLGSGSLNSSTNMRKLKINRDLRMDLFGSSESKPQSRQVEGTRAQDEQERALKKRVSFDRGTEEPTARPSKSNAIALRDDDEEEETPSSTPAPPQQKNGAGLSSVPEESAAPQQQSTAPPSSQTRQRMEPGGYWSDPPIKTLQKMSRQQLSSIENFTVGRKNIGRIVFGRNGPVDLSLVDLDTIYEDDRPNERTGGIVQLVIRNATVYRDATNKPPPGQALNVPSTIYLEQSGPRSSRLSGMPPQAPATAKAAEKELQTHRRRLSKVEGTTFKDYDPRTGIWTFTVEHYTSYGLDDSDDEDMDDDTTGVLDLQPKIPSSMRTGSSGLSEAPSSGKRSEQSGESDAESEEVEPQGPEDDTFEFKLARRSQQSNAASIPGGFDADDSMANVSYDYDDPSADEMQPEEPSQVFGSSGVVGDTSMIDDPFVEAGGAVQAPSPGAVERYRSSMMSDEDGDEVDELEQEVPGSFVPEPKAPKSILKPTAYPSAFASPEKVAELPWEEQLQRTMSPKKRDRQALRDLQGLSRVEDAVESPFKKSMLGRSQLGQSYLAEKSAKKTAASRTSTMAGKKSEAFNTGMDLINSLWGKSEGVGKMNNNAPTSTSTANKRQRLASTSTSAADPDAVAANAAWHESFKPHFTNRDVLTFGLPSAGMQQDGDFQTTIQPVVGAGLDVRFAAFKTPLDFDAPTLLLQKRSTVYEDRGPVLVDDGGQRHRDENGQYVVFQEADTSGVAGASAPDWLGFGRMADAARTGAGTVGATEGVTAEGETRVWRLCSVLFEHVQSFAPDLYEGMSDDALDEFEPRLRMEALQRFWAEMVREGVDAKIKATGNKEERALLLLVKGDVVEAAQLLIEAGNFRLATLVAQLPGSETNREVMKSQIRWWVERKDWSEFSDALRAVYSLLAGETCSVAGVQGGPEDRAKDFNLAGSFGLDWKMAFALRVQYAGFETVADAVSAYVTDLDEGKEFVLATPWHSKDGAEDTLLGLLRVYADRSADPTTLLDAQTVSGSAMNSRLAWQLASLLSSHNIIDLPDSQLDSLTLAFAAQLEAASEWVKASWVLLHLTHEPSRIAALSALLARNAAILPAPLEVDEGYTPSDGNAAWTAESLHLPASMLWEAKALYASAVLREPALQAQYLLAVSSDEALAAAHEVLISTVGPQAIISQDYDELASLIRKFQDADVLGRLQAWKTGGKVYADFLAMLRMPATRRDTREGRNASYALEKALRGVEAAGKGLEVKVAVGEMGRVVAEVRGWEREVVVDEEGKGESAAKDWGMYKKAMAVV